MTTWTEMSTLTSIFCKSLIVNIFVSLFLVTEEGEAVDNNTGWSPRATQNFDLSVPGKLK